MLISHSWWTGRALPFLAPDGDGAGGDGAQSDSNADAEAKHDESKSKNPVEQGDDKEALRRMGEQRDAARKEALDAKKERDALQREKEQREADEAKAKGDYEKLAEDRQKRIDELEANEKKRDRDDLKRAVATKHKLPEALALRLAGETEAELEADAKELAKLVKPPVAADTEAGERHRSGANGADRTKPGENAELVKAGAGYTFMPVGAVPVPDDV
jgi:hypothetical protein